MLLKIKLAKRNIWRQEYNSRYKAIQMKPVNVMLCYEARLGLIKLQALERRTAVLRVCFFF